MTKTCSVPGCDRKVHARGWCNPHWRRWIKTGDVQADVPIAGRGFKVCSISGCERSPKKKRSMCPMHCARMEKFGDPNGHAERGVLHREQCHVVGCHGKHLAKGLCSMHYHRRIRLGQLTVTKEHQRFLDTLVGLGKEERDEALEAEAYRIIKKSRIADGTWLTAYSDVLTPWTEQERRRHEVPVSAPDAAVALGMFNRVINPGQVWLNSRDGVAGALAHKGRFAQASQPDAA